MYLLGCIRSEWYWEHGGFKRDITFIIQFGVRSPNFGLHVREHVEWVTDGDWTAKQEQQLPSGRCITHHIISWVDLLKKPKKSIRCMKTERSTVFSLVLENNVHSGRVNMQRLNECNQLTIVSKVLLKVSTNENIRWGWCKTLDVCSILYFWFALMESFEVLLSWWRAAPCSRLSQDGLPERELDATIPAVQPMAPNDITSITWQLSHPRYFGLIRVQWEEVERRPSIFMSAVQTTFISSTFTWRVSSVTICG